MQRMTFLVAQVVALVVKHQIDDGPLGQRCRLVKDQTSVFDARSEAAHVFTVRISPTRRKGTQTASRSARSVRIGRLRKEIEPVDNQVDLVRRYRMRAFHDEQALAVG